MNFMFGKKPHNEPERKGRYIHLIPLLLVPNILVFSLCLQFGASITCRHFFKENDFDIKK